SRSGNRRHRRGEGGAQAYLTLEVIEALHVSDAFLKLSLQRPSDDPVKPAVRSSRCFPPLHGFPRTVTQDGADLESVIAEEARDAVPLCLGVLGMDAPLAQRFFGFEFDDRHALAILGDKALVRNVARNGLRQFADARRHRLVFLPSAGA